MKTASKIKHTALAACISAALFSLPSSSLAGGLQTQLDHVFDGMMSNTTLPGVWESQRRGVIAGGRFTAKTKIMNESLVQFTPPSWKGGCGGVDLFGGSFSFINSDQIVELLRTIAANAKGYAFQLALETVFPSGAQIMKTLQDQIQKLNQTMLNSCQTAQGVVNDTIDAMGMSELVKGTTDATLSGTGDWFRSFNETDGQSWQQQLKTSDPTRYREHKIGNLVWKQLRKNGTQTWFQYGDNDFLEAIMSITGSVIVRDLNGDDSNPIITLEGGLLTMNDLLEGGAVTLYDCGSDTDQCMMDGRSTHTVNLTGLRSQILDVLIGGTSGVGLIHKYANNTGPITNAEKNLMSSLPGSVGSIIRNLAVLSPDAAQIFAQESSGAIALSMVNNLVENMLRAGRLSLANTNHAQRETAIKMLNNATQQARHEYVSLINQYGRVSDMTDHYNNLIKNIRKQRYMLTQMKQSNNKD